MKCAISVPDDVFEKADRLARRMKKSRSELYSLAVREYLQRHSPESITEHLNKVLAEVGPDVDPFVREAARRTLRRVKW